MKVHLSIFVAVFLMAAALSSAQVPQSFSAKVRFISGQHDSSGNLFVSEGKTRVEMNGDILIFRDRSPFPYVFTQSRSSASSRFWITLSTEWHSYNLDDPCKTSRLIGFSDCQQLESADVDRQPCATWRVTKKLPELIVWIDKATGVTMRIQLANGDVMELSGVRFEKQPETLFAVPKMPKKLFKPRSDETKADSNVFEGPIFYCFMQGTTTSSCVP